MSGLTLFIGGGNMAEALLAGLLRAGEIQPDQTRVTDIRADRLRELAERFGVGTDTENPRAAAGAETIWLCVKPQQFPEVLASLRGVSPHALVVSIAAGISTRQIEQALDPGVRVVRVMPNTPALVGEGASGVSGGAQARPEDVAQVLRWMRCVGFAVEVAETDLHAVTALSGSGPAYVCVLAEAMIAAGTELGLDPVLSRELAIQTLLGTAKLMRESGLPPDELRARVTSKGGTTAAALAQFTESGVEIGLRRGIQAADARSRALSKPI